MFVSNCVSVSPMFVFKPPREVCYTIFESDEIVHTNIYTYTCTCTCTHHVDILINIRIRIHCHRKQGMQINLRMKAPGY